MGKICYLDNAATTRCLEGTADILKEANELFYNPSAGYGKAIATKKRLEESRSEIEKLLGGKNGKLVFTSSATESNNMVFRGVHIRAGQKVLISAGEHPSVYESAMQLKRQGIEVELIPLTESGAIDKEKYRELLHDRAVALVSIIHVSNETGFINDIGALSNMAKRANPNIIFHSDGVQAFGKIKVNLRNLGVDLYTISAHKIYAPRGIAALWVKEGVLVDPLLFGGGQEGGLRSSTENVAGAMCFAYCARRACDDLDKNFELVKSYKNGFISAISESEVGGLIKINSLDTCSPYILSMLVKGTKGEVLMRALDGEGVLISTGSACSAKRAGNRVLSAMGLGAREVAGSVRISFSPYDKVDTLAVAKAFERQIKRFAGAK